MDVSTIREDADSWQNLMFLYRSGMREVCTKLEIIRDQFENTYNYSPIQSIKSRLKKPESIVNKLKRHGLEVTMQNMVERIMDIAGVRLVCSFTSDIYRLADMILQQKDFEIITIKDYISTPKPSGYRSYHIIVKVPVFTLGGTEEVPVEIQIRTIAMDFWATLEHRIQYKFEGEAPDYISRDLRTCADIVASLDEKMLSLNDEINEISSRNNQADD